MTRLSIIPLCLLALLCAAPVHAAVKVSPAVIDHKAHERDILPGTVTLRNDSDREVRIYPVVNNLTAEGTQDFRSPTESDYPRSLANWIQFPRGGVSLEPGEVRRIDFEIRVSLGAPAGAYHATIAFPEGSDRAAAEMAASTAPRVNVNVEVSEVVRENVRLERFAPAARAFWQGPAAFEVVLENLGNRPATPRGDIIVYDRAGAEIAELKGNSQNAVLLPGEKGTYEANWEPRALGQYKALLSVSYGESEAVQLQDTVFFWFLPWQKVAAASVAAAFLFVGLMSYLHSRISGRHAHGPRRSGLTSDGIPHVVDLRHPSSHDHA